jgi:hypothetical protein
LPGKSAAGWTNRPSVGKRSISNAQPAQDANCDGEEMPGNPESISDCSLLQLVHRAA